MPNGHVERHALKREQVLGAAVSMLASCPEQCKNAAGILEATILFPKKPYINIIGGKGEEFFIQNKNYDENGRLWNKMKKRKKNLPEPGAWRVEIIPPFAQKNDQFLTVYNPRLIDETKNITIEPLETLTQIGCRINGNAEIHSFLFSKTKHALTIELDNGITTKNIQLSIPAL